MRLRDRLMREQGRALASTRPAFVWLRRLHTALICGLLALAFVAASLAPAWAETTVGRIRKR